MRSIGVRICSVSAAVAVCILAITLASAAEPVPKSEEDPYYGGGFTIRVVDRNGKPVEGALAGFEAIRWHDGTRKVVCNPDGTLTDADGLVKLFKGKKVLNESGRSLVAWHDESKQIGIVPATKIKLDERGVATISIGNACHVSGTLACDELTKLGHSLGWSIVFVHDRERRPVGYASGNQEYEFWLPPGEYELEAYGTKLHETRHKIRIDSEQTELVVQPIELPAVRSALLEGQPAPELRDIAAWNSKPLKLKSLRGKHVLLVFWGHWCGPCVSHMPRMFEAYERYNREELEIIGVHVGGKENSVETVETLDELLAEIREKYWSGRDLPFPIALARSQEAQHHGTNRLARSVAAADYGVVSYPTEILIDPQGNVVGDVETALGAQDWAAMDRLLGRD